jgi:hypothetical protein
MTTDVVEMIRSADPLDPAELTAWVAADSTMRLAAITSSDAELAPTRRRRVAPTLVALVGVGVAGTGVAVAAGVLGSPAPDRVQQHLAELDRGMPADLRYDADVEHARAVATTDNGVLYYADLDDGGYCLEVVTNGDLPRGATCTPAADVAAAPLDVTAPLPRTDDDPLLLGGRANAPRVDAIRLRFADGSTHTVALGLDRSWLFEVPDAARATALAGGITVIGVDSGGLSVASVDVPPLRDDDPLGTAHDADQPLVLTTISDGTDFTLVKGVEGRSNVTSARLEVRFPDGSTIPVALKADGGFRLLFPAARRDDFSDTVGALVAIRQGHVVATTPIASVAYWRAHSTG